MQCSHFKLYSHSHASSANRSVYYDGVGSSSPLAATIATNGHSLVIPIRMQATLNMNVTAWRRQSARARHTSTHQQTQNYREFIWIMADATFSVFYWPRPSNHRPSKESRKKFSKSHTNNRYFRKTIGEVLQNFPMSVDLSESQNVAIETREKKCKRWNRNKCLRCIGNVICINYLPLHK